MTLLVGFAKMEGYYQAGSRAARNFNPGNLNMEPYMMKKYGAFLEDIPPGIHEKARFAHFPDEQTGFAALHDLLSGPTYANLTIEEAVNKYAPPSDNNQTSDYVLFICHAVNCQKTDLVKDVLAL